MVSCGNLAFGLAYQSRASSSCTWILVFIAGEYTQIATRRLLYQ